MRMVLLFSLLALAVDAGAQGAAPAGTGKSIYEQRCAQCHGVSGRGDGPSASILIPRPRDFTSGKFKFRTTESGSLPTDADLAWTIRVGLAGTSMPAWAPFLSDGEINAVVAYIKTFSPRFTSELPRPIQPPVAASATPATIEAGKKVFDTLKCAACHGEGGTGVGSIAQDLKDDWGRPIAATRLTEPWTFRGGATATDIFFRFRTGLNGTPMPSFHDAANDRDLSNLAVYVASLGRKPVWEMDANQVAEFYSAQAAETARDPIGRGRYLVTTIGCSYCHTPVREDGSQIEELALAGGQRWRVVPFGDFVSFNLTSDKETGLGNWTDDQLRAFLTRGIRPDGSRMLPYPMPWTSYSNLKAEDLNAMIAYLRTIPPISNRIPRPQAPNIVSYLWGKFRMLILKADAPLVVFPGNAGTPGSGVRRVARNDTAAAGAPLADGGAR